MDIKEILNIQLSLFTFMLLGAFLRKLNAINPDQRNFLTDLCSNVIFPCMIFKSFLIEFNMSVLKLCGLLTLLGFIVEMICVFLNKFLFNLHNEEQKKIMQYGTLVPNSGFMGTPIMESLYAQTGVMYSSMFLITIRIIMWAMGPSYFIKDSKMTKKQILNKALTHPCLVACYIGLVFMIFQIKLPVFMTKTITSIASCNTALTMILVGTILPEVPLRKIINKGSVYFSFIRLAFIPALTFGLGYLLSLRGVSLEVPTILTAMPGGMTMSLYAARYDSDAAFGTQAVVLSTLLSMITLPLIYMLIHA